MITDIKAHVGFAFQCLFLRRQRNHVVIKEKPFTSVFGKRLVMTRVQLTFMVNNGKEGILVSWIAISNSQRDELQNRVKSSNALEI